MGLITNITLVYIHLFVIKFQGRLCNNETFYMACTIDSSHQSLRNLISSVPVASAVECLSLCMIDNHCLSASIDKSAQTMVCKKYLDSGIEESCCAEYNSTGRCHHYLKKENYKFLLGSSETTTASPSSTAICTDLDTTDVSATDCQWYKTHNIMACNGLYNISLNGTIVTVQCDMETEGGGWTVVFSRNASYAYDGDRTWQEYKEGFGTVTTNYWLGNENMYKLTVNRSSELYIKLINQAGQVTYAKYKDCTIASESDNYRLDFDVTSYNGTAGDALYTGGFASFNSHGMAFTTKDNDNDLAGGGHNCATSGKGGWWYNSCGAIYLTGTAFYWGNPSFGPMQLSVMMIRYI